MNTNTPNPSQLLENDHNTIPSGEVFIAFAIAMMVVAAVCLVVALLSPLVPQSHAASAATAAMTAGLC